MNKKSEFKTEGNYLIIIHNYDDGDTAKYPIRISELGNCMPGTNGVSEWVNQLAMQDWRAPEDLYELGRYIDQHVDGHNINWDRTFWYIRTQNYLGEGIEYSADKI